MNTGTEIGRLKTRATEVFRVRNGREPSPSELVASLKNDEFLELLGERTFRSLTNQIFGRKGNVSA